MPEPMEFEFTNAAEQLVTTLCHRIRVLTWQQIEQLLGKTSAKNDLLALRSAGLVNIERRLVHPEIDVSKPVLFWQPGDEEPDFYSLSSELRNRWSEAPEETKVVTATKNALRLFGGYNVKPRASEWRHDIMMSSVYLRYIEDRPHLADRWIGGDDLRVNKPWYFSDRVPDAVIVSSDGSQLERIVECGGSYHRGKLESMHGIFQMAPYEIW